MTAAAFGADVENLAWLHAPRICVHCGYTFSELGNIGRWKCRKFHPLVHMITLGHTAYPCCGRSIGAAGCVAADHTDSVMLDVERKLIDAQAASCFLAAGVVPHTQTWQKCGPGAYLIDRVDAEGLERHAEGEQAEIERFLPEVTVNRHRPI